MRVENTNNNEELATVSTPDVKKLEYLLKIASDTKIGNILGKDDYQRDTIGKTMASTKITLDTDEKEKVRQYAAERCDDTTRLESLTDRMYQDLFKDPDMAAIVGDIVNSGNTYFTELAAVDTIGDKLASEVALWSLTKVAFEDGVEVKTAAKETEPQTKEDPRDIHNRLIEKLIDTLNSVNNDVSIMDVAKQALTQSLKDIKMVDAIMALVPGTFEAIMEKYNSNQDFKDNMIYVIKQAIDEDDYAVIDKSTKEELVEFIKTSIKSWQSKESSTEVVPVEVIKPEDVEVVDGSTGEVKTAAKETEPKQEEKKPVEAVPEKKEEPVAEQKKSFDATRAFSTNTEPVKETDASEKKETPCDVTPIDVQREYKEALKLRATGDWASCKTSRDMMEELNKKLGKIIVRCTLDNIVEVMTPYIKAMMEDMACWKEINQKEFCKDWAYVMYSDCSNTAEFLCFTCRGSYEAEIKRKYGMTKTA